MKIKWRAIGSLFQYATASILLAWLLLSLNWGRTVELLRGISFAHVSVVAVVSLVNVGMWALMWQVLLKSDHQTNIYDLLRVDLVIKFVNGVLPSRLAGRTAAPLALRRFIGTEWDESLAIAGLHTGLYAVCYGAVCLVGIVALYNRVSEPVLLLILFSTVGYILAGGLILVAGLQANRVDRLAKPVIRVVRRLPMVGTRIGHFLTNATNSISNSADPFRERSVNPTVVISYGMVWTMGVVFLPGLRFWLLLEAVATGPVPFIPIPLYLVTAYSVTVLPITPGGIGITEATSALVFVSLGFPEAVVIPAIFVDRLMGIYIPSLAGWLPASRMNVVVKNGN